MKNFTYFILITFFVFPFVVACSDDFVRVDPNNVDTENYFNSEQEYENALVGAYDLLHSTYLNVLLGEIASDNTLAGGESATDVPGIQQVDDMIHTAVNTQLRDIWGWMFAGVNRANYILEFQDKTNFQNKPNVIAQAKFLRAYYYFELAKWFGPVPLVVDKRINFGDQFNLERTPLSEVYTQIENDLINAIKDLPVEQTMIGKATKGAAQGLLGKVYLYNEKFEESAEILDELINSNNYDLVPFFADLFENDTNFEFSTSSDDVNLDDDSIFIEDHILITGKEVLYTSDTPIEGLNSGSTYYAIVIDYNSIKLANSKLEAESNISIDLTDFSDGIHSLYAQYENSIESVFEIQYTDLEGGSFNCLQCNEGNVSVGFNGIRKYIGTPFGPRFESGYSFNVPTQESYDAFNAADLRRDISILNIDKWVAEWSELGVIITYGEGNEHTGFFNRKYIPRRRDLNIPDPNLTNPNNYRSIRFADVLLMAAEAHNRKTNPNDTKALEYLNRVRTRAFGISDFNTSASGNTLTQLIWNERRLELMGEGHRFFDLVRTGQAKDYIDGFELGKHELFPIPSVEIELTGNIWEQNPGY
tara:strand:- start:3753 stop:5519 length:1767 start_codon:yes stop_codon:yes gene_type:complete